MYKSKQIDLPLGRIGGLTALSVATLAGVIAGLDPFVITMRAGLAAVAVGIAGYVVGRITVEFLKSN